MRVQGRRLVVMRLLAVLMVYGSLVLLIRGEGHPSSPLAARADETEVAVRPRTSASSLQRLQKLEFNGFMQMGGKLRFSIYDPRAKRNFWIAQQDPADGFVVVRFDREKLVVSVLLGGHQRDIVLNDTSIKPLLTVEDRRRRYEQRTWLDARDSAVGFMLQKERAQERAERLRAREARQFEERR